VICHHIEEPDLEHSKIEHVSEIGPSGLKLFPDFVTNDEEEEIIEIIEKSKIIDLKKRKIVQFGRNIKYSDGQRVPHGITSIGPYNYIPDVIQTVNQRIGHVTGEIYDQASDFVTLDASGALATCWCYLMIVYSDNV